MAVKDLLLFKTIFEQSSVSTQIFTPDGETILVNKAWEKLWKVKFSQVKSYNILKDQQLVEKGVMPQVKRGFKGHFVNIPAIKYEPSLTVKVKGVNTTRWLQAVIYPIHNQQGNITHVVLQHEDLTSGERSAHNLFESEERLRLALNAGNIGVWDWDIERNKLTWTEKVYEIHGVDQKTFRVSVKKLINLVHPEDVDRFKQTLKQSLKDSDSFGLEFRIITPKNELRWLSIKATIYRDRQSAAVRMLGASSDITNQKQLEQDKSDFLSMASHELKTPLTSMKMFIELVNKQLRDIPADRAKYYFKRIEDQANRLSELTNDLLDVSRIETGKLRLNKERIRLDELITDTVEGIQPSTSKQQIVILSNPRIIVAVDRYRIYQVLVNLLTNAIKYSPKADKIIVSVLKKDKEVIVSVQDFGIGIKKVHQPKVFDRLYQAAEPDEKTFPGLGLGLYISKEIIERHHGRIWVSSQKGRGSIFSFSLSLTNKR